MFTGIIEEVGHIKKLTKGAKSVALTVSAHKVLNGTHLGDSIATNGICLTVTNMTQDAFTVDVMHETLNRTAMHTLKVGDRVNLERALTLSTRLGGHMVSGHIDGVGYIQSLRTEDIATVITIKTSPDLLRYVIEKGSIALDGISLTVIHVTHDTFSVSIIPHTKDETTLLSKKVNDQINIECDLVGKYIEKLMSPKGNGSIDEAMLKKYGF